MLITLHIGYKYSSTRKQQLIQSAIAKVALSSRRSLSPQRQFFFLILLLVGKCDLVGLTASEGLHSWHRLLVLLRKSLFQFALLLGLLLFEHFCYFEEKFLKVAASSS